MRRLKNIRILLLFFSEPHLLQPPEEKSSDWKLDLFSVL